MRKACKFCGLAIAPSIINSIKPKILSQFFNSDIPQDEHSLASMDRLKISELVYKFAFNKVSDGDAETKRQFRDTLESGFSRLQTLK